MRSALVPLSPFEEKAVDQNTFSGLLEALAFDVSILSCYDFLLNICLVVDFIK
jgi:hypothetical protein